MLKATHMASDEASVQKKAETIMKQADKDGDNQLNMEEYLVIAKKFPNIVVPSFDKAS